MAGAKVPYFPKLDKAGNDPVHRVEHADWETVLDVAASPNLPGSSNQSADNDARPSWDFGAGFDGAIKLARTGWKKGREAFVTGMAQALTNKDAQFERATWTRDVCGARPSVGAFCAGDPRSMWRQRRVEQVKPIVSVLVNIQASAMVPASVFMNRGIAIASWIDAAEDAGTRVELTIGWPINEGSGMADLRIPLKQAGDVLDADRLAFALAHPAFFRRIGFALIERDSVLMERALSWYGSPTDYSDTPDDVIYFPPLSGYNQAPYESLDAACAHVDKVCEEARVGNSLTWED